MNSAMRRLRILGPAFGAIGKRLGLHHTVLRTIGRDAGRNPLRYCAHRPPRQSCSLAYPPCPQHPWRRVRRAWPVDRAATPELVAASLPDHRGAWHPEYAPSAAAVARVEPSLTASSGGWHPQWLVPGILATAPHCQCRIPPCACSESNEPSKTDAPSTVGDAGWQPRGRSPQGCQTIEQRIHHRTCFICSGLSAGVYHHFWRLAYKARPPALAHRAVDSRSASPMGDPISCKPRGSPLSG